MSGTVGDNIYRASGVVASAGGGGRLGQIVVVSSDSTVSGTTSTSYTDLSTNFQLQITPTASDSQIWIRAASNGSCGGGPARYQIDRDSGTQVVESGLGSSGSGFIVLEALDSPSTTSQITYKVQYKNTGGASGHTTYWKGGDSYRYMFVAVEILAE